MDLPEALKMYPAPGAHVAVGELKEISVGVDFYRARQPGSALLGYAYAPDLYLDGTKLKQKEGVFTGTGGSVRYILTEPLHPGLHQVRAVFPKIELVHNDSVREARWTYEEVFVFEWEFCLNMSAR